MNRRNVIDFHTHAFPDHIAPKAIPALEKAGDIQAMHNGTVTGLLASMDTGGVDISVVASIATKPEQYTSILEWSKQIRSRRIFPFPSVHPEDPAILPRITEIAVSGFKGIKLHPFYQDFRIDEERMYPVYRCMAEHGLILLMHCGFDIAYPHEKIADPEKTARVLEDIPSLKFVASHFGAWQDWAEVEKHLAGKKVYFDVSASLDFIESGQAARIIQKHPPEYILFGTDSPWYNQKRVIEQAEGLGLSEKSLDMILSANAAELLNLY